MPCSHGKIFWWECSQCRRNKEIQERNAVFNRLCREREKREVEHQTLQELMKIRQLLEVEFKRYNKYEVMKLQARMRRLENGD